MKLLTVSPFFESHRGGVEIVAGRLARELVGHGLDVTWLAGDASPPPEAMMRCVPLSASNLLERRVGVPYPLLSPSAVMRLVRAVRQADAVLVHDSLYLTSLVAAAAARLSGKPLVVVQHIGEVLYRSPVLRGMMKLANALLARPLLRSADQVVFISEITARHFEGLRFRRPPLLVFNGVDTEVFQPGASARFALGLPMDGPVALFVGRFVEKKGLHLMERLARARPDVCWAFAGWGALDPSRWSLPNVTVFDGLSGASLAELYRASDVLVLPSTGEGFPLVIQEALACGLPVVCGAQTATADPVAAPLLSGVALAGPEAEVTARLSAAVDTALADRANSAARVAFVRGRYAWSSVGERYARLLESLVAQRRTGEASPAVINRAAT